MVLKDRMREGLFQRLQHYDPTLNPAFVVQLVRANYPSRGNEPSPAPAVSKREVNHWTSEYIDQGSIDADGLCRRVFGVALDDFTDAWLND